MRLGSPLLFFALGFLYGRRRAASDPEPGMAEWYATVLGDIARFGGHG